MYKIGICGYGVVGQGIHRLFKDQVVAVYDPYKGKSDVETYGQIKLNEKEAFSNLDLVVISVMTKEMEDWSADTSILFDSLKWLAEIRCRGVILIKSTTPPSVLRKISEEYWRVVFSPEMMGESRYFTPFWKYPDPKNMESHTWQVFGGNKGDTSRCIDIFKRVMSVDTQFVQTDIVTAGLAKYIENSFFAMKVTFCNEWFGIAETYGVNWNELRELWLLDTRINRNHTLVFPNDRGYGGKCYPKDTRAIMKESSDLGYKPELMLAMDKVNNKFRKQ